MKKTLWRFLHNALLSFAQRRGQSLGIKHKYLPWPSLANVGGINCLLSFAHTVRAIAGLSDAQSG